MATDRRAGSLNPALLAALVIALLWILMAAAALASAARGFANDRPDWGLGWGLVGVLLLAAGIAAFIGTLWHQRSVLRNH